ncbi:hypothetical protein HYN59_00715 [Flavobacterium album]|uniref:Uncharacterized protein n=1 Tax=Flavobacterium album TaxID=2175091 RepID=A0A2S1QTL1_9FLAO|nr:hypothetical protein [Flavobacterium album]AWH83725.1 hypothetical protein HYN59_00715 [Flavobacterium album]
MKKLLFTFFILACGATALANTADHIAPPNIEKASNVTVASKKIPVARTEKVKVNVKQPKETPAKFCTSVDGSRFGLGVYIVDLVNTGNIKLTNLLLAK